MLNHSEKRPSSWESNCPLEKSFLKNLNNRELFSSPGVTRGLGYSRRSVNRCWCRFGPLFSHLWIKQELLTITAYQYSANCNRSALSKLMAIAFHFGDTSSLNFTFMWSFLKAKRFDCMSSILIYLVATILIIMY